MAYELTPEMVKEPSYGRDRYFLVDVDGRCSFSGYMQRPAAERNCRHGYGLWDKREKEVLIQPNLPERLNALGDSQRYHEKKVREAKERAAALKAWVRVHQTHT